MAKGQFPGFSWKITARFLLGLLLAALVGYAQFPRPAAEMPGSSPVTNSAETALVHAFEKRLSNLQVEGEGVVAKRLADDTKGLRHQRFLLRMSSGLTVLVAHNIDLAPRIERLEEGDTVYYSGEYEWSAKGGVIHWTHRDPKGRHMAGWLRHKGRVYQ